MDQNKWLDLVKYDIPTPRYTSYPPAPFFREDPDAMNYGALLRESNETGQRNLGFYFHIPFCPKRCLFCGCSTEIGRAPAFIRDYMESLPVEFDRVAAYISSERPVTQIHFGGGTPNAVPFKYLRALLDQIRSRFTLDPHAELAIECDPNLVSEAKLEDLRAMGFNRVSFGLQDFNREVLAAVNRGFPPLAPDRLISLSHALGFRGINLDLIYGLPLQTPVRFLETIKKTLAANPDRISLFPYAHVPWVKEHQKKLESMRSPDATERLEIAYAAREAITAGGYVSIGMDHFAKPEDDLAVALKNGNLRRNFQGYCSAEKSGQIYALGASAISQLQNGFLQNVKDAGQYVDRIKAGGLAYDKAYRLKPQDYPVSDIIQDLLCNACADVGNIVRKSAMDPDWKRTYLETSHRKLHPYVKDGLVEETKDFITLTERGRYVSRLIAAAFDPLVEETALTGPRYSKSL